MDEPDDKEHAAVQFAGIAMGRAVASAKADLRACGLKPTRVLMVIELDIGEETPIRTAASWPEGDTAGVIELAKEGLTAVQMAHASRQVRGQG